MQQKKKDTQSDILSCVPRGTRTLDPLIKSQLLGGRKALLINKLQFVNLSCAKFLQNSCTFCLLVSRHFFVSITILLFLLSRHVR